MTEEGIEAHLDQQEVDSTQEHLRNSDPGYSAPGCERRPSSAAASSPFVS